MQDMDFIGKLMVVEQDHLKDAQMLIDSAMHFKTQGHTTAMQYFVEEAKHRLAKYDSVHSMVHQMTAGMKTADPDTLEAMCCKHAKEHIAKWVEKMKLCVSAWS